MENQLIDLRSIDQILNKAKQLQAFIDDNPDTLQFLRLLKDTKVEQITLSEKVDKLITLKEAAEVLAVSPNRICEYVREGILEAYFTPPVSKRKFWLSAVKSIAQKGDFKNDTVQGKS